MVAAVLATVILVPPSDEARANHGGPHEPDIVVNGGKKTSCPVGATCLPPGSLNHHPQEVLLDEEEVDRLVNDFINSVTPSPPLDMDGDGVLDCWRGLTGNWNAPMTSPFGAPRSGGPHKGIDIGTPTGTSVRAGENGTVVAVYKGMSEGEKTASGPYTTGNFVKIDYGGGRIARYLHLLPDIVVARNESVSVGQMIGNVNDTGNSRRPHLHYDLNVNDGYVNPADDYDC